MGGLPISLPGTNYRWCADCLPLPGAARALGPRWKQRVGGERSLDDDVPFGADVHTRISYTRCCTPHDTSGRLAESILAPGCTAAFLSGRSCLTSPAPSGTMAARCQRAYPRCAKVDSRA